MYMFIGHKTELQVAVFEAPPPPQLHILPLPSRPFIITQRYTQCLSSSSVSLVFIRILRLGYTLYMYSYDCKCSLQLWHNRRSENTDGQRFEYSINNFRFSVRIDVRIVHLDMCVYIYIYTSDCPARNRNVEPDKRRQHVSLWTCCSFALVRNGGGRRVRLKPVCTADKIAQGQVCVLNYYVNLKDKMNAFSCEN